MTKVGWDAQLSDVKSREQQAARWAAAEGFVVELEELETDFRGMVRRLRQSPLRRAACGWTAPGELWRQVADPMRDNTLKKHAVGCRTQWLAPLFQRCLWQGLWRVRRQGLAPMWWHRSISSGWTSATNNKEGCNAVRLVNAFSPECLWLRSAHVQTRDHRAERERCRALAQGEDQLCDYQLRCCLACCPWTTRGFYDNATSLLATMEIQGADQNILIRPGSGTAQGSEGAAEAFHRV